MVALMTFIGMLWMAGGNDIIALLFHLNLNYITYFIRVMVFLGPVLAFLITRRWCISLQRADQDRLLHGYESGIIMRSPEGAYAEKHVPISVNEAYTLTARDRHEEQPLPSEVDENGVANRHVRLARLRTRLANKWYEGDIEKPTRAELEAAHDHAAHDLAVGDDGHQHLTSGDYTGDYELDGQTADGHQFDGRRATQGDELRKG
jgi:ubiquinol-cytochrome c reductase cytochrome b subunit